MKKYTRQRIILDLVENNEIKTQEELSECLEKRDSFYTSYSFKRYKGIKNFKGTN